MVVINLDADRVQMTLNNNNEGMILHGKSVEWMCLLLTSDDWVTARDVHALPAWSAMAQESVGKQIARQIDTLRMRGFDLIEWRHKTINWRLKPGHWELAAPFTHTAARDFLDHRKASATRRFATVPLDDMTRWAMNSATATVAITAGHVAKGYAALKSAYAATDHPDLLAISDILATRIGQRLERAHDPVPGNLGRYPSVFELSVEARRMAAYAIRSESSAWEGQVKELLRLLPRLSGIGSLNSTAYVLNGIALLLRRLGRHEEALNHIHEAVPLAIFSGDLTLIQSVFFNLGNILSELRRTDPARVAPADPSALLEMDVAIRRTFGLGKDSAQAELLLAYLALEDGALDRAADWLAESAALIELNRIPNDRALFHRIAGLLSLARAPGNTDGLKELEKAITLFQQVGNRAAAARVSLEHDQHAALAR